jgi:DNA-binding NarL/FixJ family response regulator
MLQETNDYPSPQPAVEPLSLLIVDDSPYVVKSLKLVLRSVPGLDISTASDGSQAVEKVRQAAPDLVLMDVQMPRMNGFEATKRVKLCAPETKVVMMSVHDHEAVRKASRASGADHFVTKDRLHRTLLPRMKAFFPGLNVWT